MKESQMDVLFLALLCALVASGAMYASTAFHVLAFIVLAPVAVMFLVFAVMLLVSAFQKR
jgi:hypothetical protein